MTQVNGRKRVFVTFNDWKNIENVARFQEAETTLDERFFQSTTFKNEPELTTIKPLHAFIDRTKLILKKEKVLPIDLKRAIFLSDVFAEKENHLKFTKILQKIHFERKKAEQERMMNEQKERLAMQRENNKKTFQSKLLLGRRQKEEMCLMKKRTKEQRRQQIETEKEEMMRMNKEREKNEEKQKLAELQKRAEIRKLAENDLQQELKLREKIEKEEKENRNFDCQFPLTAQDSAKISQDKKKAEDVKSLSTTIGGKMKLKTHDFAAWSLPLSKSEIERKRDLYQKKLKEERIVMYNNQIRELLHKKEQENYQKQVEFQKRIQNLDVTNSFFSRRNRQYLETVKENRHIWDQQCREQKLRHENERLEDVQRLQKLKHDMRKEDEEYLQDIFTAWRKCKSAGKNTFPILKCIREFAKSHNISVAFEQ